MNPAEDSFIDEPCLTLRQHSTASGEDSISQSLDIALDTCPSLVSSGCPSTAPFADNGTFSSFNSVDDQILLVDRSRVSYAPTPPRSLLVLENLFHNVKVYFESICRNMIFDHAGTLLMSNGAQLQYDLCNDFDSYCFTASILLGNGSYGESYRALSRACALVKRIIQAEHP
ncbi:hypothetical protein EJ04DRAFT_365458 [Polyplosphaeria fusca]|uniref:Uncharacterized protein n=1 Tax=Polyplosphaeria fusca TaxID=682080 RepID=A0A9P4QV92_9PLEO|nr:hypothetical protein EJ04DRAFT_365458 [Polyplosphaeria fusca]